MKNELIYGHILPVKFFHFSDFTNFGGKSNSDKKPRIFRANLGPFGCGIGTLWVHSLQEYQGSHPRLGSLFRVNLGNFVTKADNMVMQLAT